MSDEEAIQQWVEDCDRFLAASPYVIVQTDSPRATCVLIETFLAEQFGDAVNDLFHVAILNRRLLIRAWPRKELPKARAENVLTLVKLLFSGS